MVSATTILRIAMLRHELWEDPAGHDTFCLAGPDGDGARDCLPPGSRLIWTADAACHFDAMTLYYAYRKRGRYETQHPWDFEPYPDAWLERQNSSPKSR